MNNQKGARLANNGSVNLNNRSSSNPQDSSAVNQFLNDGEGGTKMKLDIRRDRYGNSIKLGSKQHKISFKDHLNKDDQLSDVYEVESWKKYNAMESGEEESFKCKCIIF
ncbi:UNKNOWN [Stylonychia lemnae]|uniref:Uncharacterized protein n=1 Tax=Stylonychia lemnae TaxID=5949 RepID=A0A077ZWW4_STYLE|nr:UNKNOWN [Stylonychia lemnae]|eukprot:CDW74091.1 UNKNOWN [Stylonychia lemnae]